MRTPDRASERRLEELRREAERRGHGAARPAPGAFPRATPETGYYGLPLLKRPPWTWELPVYFFVGGIAGTAAVIADVARRTGQDPALARDARWIAAGGGALSGALLTKDLGRPERFLAMLRIFKPQSPMSVGAWTLLLFSKATSAALFADIVEQRYGDRVPVKIVRDAGDFIGAISGAVLATYTGVLVGATAIPVWAQNIRVLPFDFGVSGVGAAVSLLELMGHDEAGLQVLGIAAAVAETAAGADLERRHELALRPLKRGVSGWTTRLGGVLSGPVPLALRLLAGRYPAARRAAGVSALVGSLLVRIGWFTAGRRSARDPRVPLELPAAVERAAALRGATGIERERLTQA
jgi:hypothetical protein